MSHKIEALQKMPFYIVFHRLNVIRAIPSISSKWFSVVIFLQQTNLKVSCFLLARQSSLLDTRPFRPSGHRTPRLESLESTNCLDSACV